MRHLQSQGPDTVLSEPKSGTHWPVPAWNTALQDGLRSVCRQIYCPRCNKRNPNTRNVMKSHDYGAGTPRRERVTCSPCSLPHQPRVSAPSLTQTGLGRRRDGGQVPGQGRSTPRGLGGFWSAAKSGVLSHMPSQGLTPGLQTLGAPPRAPNTTWSWSTEVALSLR